MKKQKGKGKNISAEMKQPILTDLWATEPEESVIWTPYLMPQSQVQTETPGEGTGRPQYNGGCPSRCGL